MKKKYKKTIGIVIVLSIVLIILISYLYIGLKKDISQSPKLITKVCENTEISSYRIDEYNNVYFSCGIALASAQEFSSNGYNSFVFNTNCVRKLPLKYATNIIDGIVYQTNVWYIRLNNDCVYYITVPSDLNINARDIANRLI